MGAWEQIANVVVDEVACLGDVPTMTRVTFRLIAAATVGGILGFERETKGKSAGMRTHMLVSLGAAVIVLATVVNGAGDDAISRVIQGVVAGIGFLGAGAIVKGRGSQDAKGLTTAASIWIAAAVGVAVGQGRAGVAIVAVSLAIVILHLLPTDLQPQTRNDAQNRGPN